MSRAGHLVTADITHIVAILVYTRNGFPAYITAAVTILVGTELIESMITSIAFVLTFVNPAHIRHPYSAVIAEMIIFFVVYVILSGYRAYGELIAYVTQGVIIVIEAKIGEASAANIADVIIIIIYVSVVIGIPRLSAIVAVAVIVAVATLKGIIASVALVIAVGALVHAAPDDQELDFLLGHRLARAVVTEELISCGSINGGRSDCLAILEFNNDRIDTVDRISVLIYNIEGYCISYSLVVDLKNRATVGKNLKSIVVESLEDERRAIIVNNELIRIVKDPARSAVGNLLANHYIA